MADGASGAQRLPPPLCLRCHAFAFYGRLTPATYAAHYAIKVQHYTLDRSRLSDVYKMPRKMRLIAECWAYDSISYHRFKNYEE